MFNVSPAARRAAIALVAALGVAPFAARAQVFKCPLADGSIGYQSAPCTSAGKPSTHPTAAQLNAARASQPKADDKPFVDPYARGASTRPRAPGAPLPSVAAPPRNERRAATDEDRQRRCTIALNNQTVLKQPGQAFSYDKTGREQPVAESERERLYQEAERAAAANCR